MRRFFPALALALVSACGGAEPAPRVAKKSVLATLASTDAGPAPARKDPPRADSTLLSRNVLFSNPDRAMPTLSPDGKRLAYLSSVDGDLNVWVGPVGDLAKAKPVTQDTKRGIRTYRWAFTNDHILYTQ